MNMSQISAYFFYDSFSCTLADDILSGLAMEEQSREKYIGVPAAVAQRQAIAVRDICFLSRLYLLVLVLRCCCGRVVFVLF